MKIKQPYNANVAAQTAVLASLEDIEYLRNNITKIIIERERLFSKLKEIQWLNTYPSSANFILCSVQKDANIVVNGSSELNKGPLARQVWYQMRMKGVFIRYFDTPGLENFIRITVGRPEDTDRVVKALTEVVKNV